MGLPTMWSLVPMFGLMAGAVLLFGSSANAGFNPVDPGGNLECEKNAFTGFNQGPATDVIQGEIVTYEVFCQILIDANDPAGVGEITINDQLPDNFEIEFASCQVLFTFFVFSGTVPPPEPPDRLPPFPAQVDGQNVTCVFPSPAFDNVFPQVVEMTIEGKFDKAPCGEIKNIAVSEFFGDTEVDETVVFLECFDVSVTKTASTVSDSTGATVLAGGTIIYVIEVCNVAPAPALVNNVFFFDQLPLGTQFQSSASADFDLAFDATSSQVLGTTDQLQAGECGTAFITVSVADDAPCGLVLTNTVVAGSATGIISDFPFDPSNFVLDEDADPSDNEATVTTTVACPEEDEDGKDDDDGGPSVGTGDTGLLDGDSNVAGWQLGLLTLLAVASLGGAYVAARRFR